MFPERIEKQFEFLKEIDKEKNLADGMRKENDAEHAWHMALFVMVLSEYANEDIDVLKTMKIVLIHDLIEIYAGDTYAYDSKGNESKRGRELAAADRLFNILPKDQAEEFRALWDEFEENITPEARFANTMDKIQPLMLNNASEGRSWEEHGVHASQVYGRNEKTHLGSEELWKYADETFIRPNVGRQLKRD